MLWTAALQALVATKDLVVRDALDEAGKPKLPANFHATMYMTSTYSDVICEFTATGSCEGHPWVMSQDDDTKLFAQSFRVENRFAPASYAGSGKSFFNTTSVTTSTGSFDVMNGLCYPMDYGGTPSTYTNMWQWVPLSRRRADAVVDGTECAVWALSLGGMDLLVAVGKDSGNPVEYNISNTKANYSYSFRFVSFAEGADPDVLRGFDEAPCASPPTCAEPGATGAVATADAYIFQGRAEDRDDDAHLRVLPRYAHEAVLRVVPEKRRARVQARAVLLHDDARDDVFEGPVQRLELLEAGVDDRVDLVVHELGLVLELGEARGDRVLDQVLDVLLRELVLVHGAGPALGPGRLDLRGWRSGSRSAARSRSPRDGARPRPLSRETPDHGTTDGAAASGGSARHAATAQLGGARRSAAARRAASMPRRSSAGRQPLPDDVPALLVALGGPRPPDTDAGRHLLSESRGRPRDRAPRAADCFVYQRAAWGCVLDT